MVKLFFYANFERDNNASGITKKIFAEMESFCHFGYEVFYTCYLDNSVAICNYSSNQIICSKKYYIKSKKINHIRRRYMLLNLARKYLKNNNFDLIYMRYHYFDKSYYKFLKVVNTSSKRKVMEMHSYPCLGSKGIRNKYFNFCEKKYQKKCTDIIDLFANMSCNALPFNKPEVHIRNTFNITDILKKNNYNDKNKMYFISVAFERDAHGFDRVIRGLHDYISKNENLKYEIKMIFVGKYLTKTIKLVNDLNLNDYFDFIGPKEGKELDDIYDIADIGIGHLANHRVNSFSGSAIKTQEFLAKGIPFIYAWNEEMLPSDFEYALKFNLDDSPLDFNKIIDFYEKIICIGKDNVTNNMRKFFEENAGWDNQIVKIISFFD